MSNSFTTDITKWQGVDNEPTAESDNLVNSNGIKTSLLINDYSFVGQGSTFVWSDKISVLAGHIYRIFVKNPNVDLSGISTGYIFALNTAKDASSAPVKVAYSSGMVLDEYYDIAIPTNADTLYIGGRCATDVKSVFYVEDITVCSELDSKIDNIQKSSLLKLTQSDTYAASNDYIHLNPNGSWYGTKVRCAVGDKFVVRGVGGSGYRLYFTCDYAGKIIRTAAAGLNTLNNGMVLTIEEGEAWLVMNTNNANSSLERTTTNNTIKEFADESYWHINECSNYSAFKYRGGINNDGANYTSTNVLRTGFINVSQLYQGSIAKKVQFKCYYYSFNNNGGIFCYNPRREYIGKYTGGVTTTNEEPYISGEIGLADLPENTYYIRMFKRYNDDGYCIGAYEDGLHFADIVFASDDSTDEAKMSANIVSSDINIIIIAINSLHSKGGGTIFLRNGTYSTDSTTVRLLIYDDVHIVGETAEKTIIRSNSHTDVTFINCTNGIISNVNIRKYYIPETGVKVWLDNVIVNGERITGYAEYYYMIAAPNSSAADKVIADRVINDGDNMPEIISDALTRYHNVRLLAGSYTLGANAVQISVDNCHLKGMGSNTVYVYRTGGNPAIVTTAAVTGTVIEHIKTPTTICIGNEGAHNSKIIDCDIKTAGGKDKHINSVSIGTPGLNVIEVGSGKDMESLLGAKSLIDDATNPATDVRNRIVLYGHIKESIAGPNYWDKTLELYGATDNAEIEIEYTTNGYDGFTIRDGNSSNYVPNYSRFKDVTFCVSGECNGANFAAVRVLGNFLYFENVVFKNLTSCADAYNPGPDDNTLRNGDRRHGILVGVQGYDEECKTEFHNCKAIGSPYGFKNTRGWYIFYGSPRLYDCIGCGSGIGRRGYGIVCHVASKPYIYNSVFYGSPYGWGLNNGIQFQAGSQAVLVGCIGFAGNGYQHISNGGTDIVNQGSLCEASHGIGCLMSVTPRLVNCQAFAGDADGSSAIYTDNQSAPEIIGGFYGKDTKVYPNSFSVDNGRTYMTLTSFGNDARNIDVKYIYLRDMSGNNVSNIANIEIRTGSAVIAETTSHSTEITMNIVNKRVTADAVVTCHVLDDNGNDISTGVSFDIFARYKVANSMSCVLMQGESYPTIHKAVFEGNDESDGIIIDTSATDYLIEDCTIDIPAIKKVVKATSAKSNVPIVNCLFKSQLTENIDSFASVTQLGSNIVL